MKNWIENKINKIDQRVEKIDYAIYNYGLDIWGTSALGNLEIIRGLEEEKRKILKKRSFWSLFRKDK